MQGHVNILLGLVPEHSLICVEQGPKRFILNLNILLLIDAKQSINRFSPIVDALHKKN
jgi:hypothetical protein